MQCMETKYYFKETNIILRERKRNAWERNVIMMERNDILMKQKS